MLVSAKKAKQKAKGFTKKKNSPPKPGQEPGEFTSNAPVDYSEEVNGDSKLDSVSQPDGALGDSEEQVHMISCKTYQSISAVVQPHLTHPPQRCILTWAQEYRPHIDLLASGADGEESLPAVTKGQV